MISFREHQKECLDATEVHSKGIPEVKLKLVLEIDGFEEIIDSIDYTQIIADLIENPEVDFDENNIFDYIMEIRDKM